VYASAFDEEGLPEEDVAPENGDELLAMAISLEGLQRTEIATCVPLHRPGANVSELQSWLPYCNRHSGPAMLWLEASQVLPKEGLNESPRYAPAQLSVAS
jgi:hypothetical protein